MAAERLTADTSVVVASILENHPFHESAQAAVSRIRWLPAHSLAESFSILTSIPRPERLTPAQAWEVLRDAFPQPPVALSAERYADTIRRLAAAGAAGGRVYDAIIAATALDAGARLISADRRAAPTYAIVGVDFDLIS